MMFLPFGTNLLCMYVCSVAVEYTTYKPCCQVNYEKILNQMPKEPLLLFCVTRYGWGWENYKAEVNTGKGLKVHDWMRGYLTYGLPLIVIFIFLFGIYDKFFK